MRLLDDPPHRATVLASDASADAAAGPLPLYTVAASDVPCLVQNRGASEQDTLGSLPQRTTWTVSFVAAALARLPGGQLHPGWLLEVPAIGRRLRIVGIDYGQAVGQIPALIYVDCEAVG